MFNTLATVPRDNTATQPTTSNPTSDHLQRCMDSVQELAKSIARAMDEWHGHGLLGCSEIHDSYARVLTHIQQLPTEVECTRCTRRAYKSNLRRFPSRVDLPSTCTCDLDPELAAKRRRPLPPLILPTQTEPPKLSLAIETTNPPAACSSYSCMDIREVSSEPSIETDLERAPDELPMPAAKRQRPSNEPERVQINVDRHVINVDAALASLDCPIPDEMLSSSPRHADLDLLDDNLDLDLSSVLAPSSPGSKTVDASSANDQRMVHSGHNGVSTTHDPSSKRSQAIQMSSNGEKMELYPPSPQGAHNLHLDTENFSHQDASLRLQSDLDLGKMLLNQRTGSRGCILRDPSAPSSPTIPTCRRRESERDDTNNGDDSLSGVAKTSARGERIIYRERDRSRETERDPDSRRSYTTVKRYQVPNRSWEEDKVDYDKIIVKHERREDPPPPKPRTELDFRVTERGSRDYQRRDDEWCLSERMTEREAPRRDIPYRVIEREQVSAPCSSFHYSGRERETVRVPSPPTQDRVREFRFERERVYSPPHSHHHHHHEPEIERYRRETEYYQQPQPQPQPIIIRESAPQAPIIIREERREPLIIREGRREPQQIIIRREEPNYDFVGKEEVRNEHQSLVRREEPPPPAPTPKSQEEDYFYERRIREVDRGRHREDIRPKDSASQYSGDDSYEYIRRERYVERGSREGSRHRRRDLTGCALAGIAGAEIIRAHRKREGRDPGGRGRSIVGGAAVSALGAEAIRRAKSWHRGSGSRSRSRSWSGSRSRSRESRHRRKHHRFKSRSKSRTRQLGGLAAVAAVGTLAGYALKNRGKGNETIIVNDRPPRRSRSRRRRGSVDSSTTVCMSEGAPRSESKARDPEYRNRRIAQAGLASAAAAGIWERVRSKSRGKNGKSCPRSRSRIRQGVPIAAAGLGGAALVELYEKTQVGKVAKKQAFIDNKMNRGRPSRSLPRSMSVPAPDPDHGRSRGVDRDNMIAYGDGSIYYECGARGYHSDKEPGLYRRRHRGGSTASSLDTRRGSRDRSKSRRKQLAGAGLAAGAVGAGAYAHDKSRDHKRGASEERGEWSPSLASKLLNDADLLYPGHEDDYSGSSSTSRSTRRGGRRGSFSSSSSRSRGGPNKAQTERQWAHTAQAAIGAGGIDKFLYNSPDEKSKRHLAEAVIGGVAANRLANGSRSRSRGPRSTPEKTTEANEPENEIEDEAAEKKNPEDDEFDEDENDIMNINLNAEKYFDDGEEDYEDGDWCGAIGDDFDEEYEHAVRNDDATSDVGAVQALLSRWLNSSASALLLKRVEAFT